MTDTKFDSEACNSSIIAMRERHMNELNFHQDSFDIIVKYASHMRDDAKASLSRNVDSFSHFDFILQQIRNELRGITYCLETLAARKQYYEVKAIEEDIMAFVKTLQEEHLKPATPAPPAP